MKNVSRNSRIFPRVLFFLYCLAMLYLLFFRSLGTSDELSYREQLTRNSNLIPFYTIRNYIYVVLNSSDSYLVRHCFINLAGNVLLFVPAGILIPSIWDRHRKFFYFLVTGIGIMLTVEILQLVTLLGRFDVDDLILNLWGMVMGFLLWKIGYFFAAHHEGDL